MKRLRLIAIIAIVLLVGGIIVHRVLNSEPSYQGRTLTEWLQAHAQLMTGSPSAPDSGLRWEASQNAVRHIGTNAIPVLLKKLVTQDTFLEQRLQSWLGSQKWIKFQFTHAQAQQNLAKVGFNILGTDAQTATPALVKLTQHPDPKTRCSALWALHVTHNKSESIVPIIQAALKDPDPLNRYIAGICLRDESPVESQKAGVISMSPGRIPSGTVLTPTNAPEANK